MPYPEKLREELLLDSRDSACGVPRGVARKMIDVSRERLLFVITLLKSLFKSVVPNNSGKIREFTSDSPGRSYNSTNDLWSVCKLKDQSTKLKVMPLIFSPSFYGGFKSEKGVNKSKGKSQKVK